MAGNEFMKDPVNYMDGSGETGVGIQSSRSYPRAEVTLMQFMMESAKLSYMKKKLSNGILEVRKFWNNSWKVNWAPVSEEAAFVCYVVLSDNVYGTNELLVLNSAFKLLGKGNWSDLPPSHWLKVAGGWSLEWSMGRLYVVAWNYYYLRMYDSVTGETTSLTLGTGYTFYYPIGGILYMSGNSNHIGKITPVYNPVTNTYSYNEEVITVAPASVVYIENGVFFLYETHSAGAYNYTDSVVVDKDTGLETSRNSGSFTVIDPWSYIWINWWSPVVKDERIATGSIGNPVIYSGTITIGSKALTFSYTYVFPIGNPVGDWWEYYGQYYSPFGIEGYWVSYKTGNGTGPFVIQKWELYSLAGELLMTKTGSTFYPLTTSLYWKGAKNNNTRIQGMYTSPGAERIYHFAGNVVDLDYFRNKFHFATFSPQYDRIFYFPGIEKDPDIAAYIGLGI